MIYTDAEITSMFRGAKKKNEQLKILAELNCCSVDEMRDHLNELGCENVPKKHGPAKGTTYKKVEKKTQAEKLENISARSIIEAFDKKVAELEAKCELLEKELAEVFNYIRGYEL